MSIRFFNQREKIAAPPFVTVSVQNEKTRKGIFKTFWKLGKCETHEKILIFSSEADLLKAFVVRKGTQLRLEKALMLTRRILTLVLRWKSNACWNDFCKFKEAFESDDAKLKAEKRHSKTDRVKGNMKEIRLPSRQWANWVIYLTLRDLLLLSKIKYECERTVGYWLGMISCSHHPSDSLIIVGILSRIWSVSSGMVEEYANQIYPSLCFISSLLNPTKAENWLQDIDFPNDLFTWLEKILGFPFMLASIGGAEHIFSLEDGVRGGRTRPSGSSSNRMDKVLSGALRSFSKTDKRMGSESTPSSSSHSCRAMNYEQEEVEDLGEPVTIQQQPASSSKKRKKQKPKEQQTFTIQTNKKVVLDERWTKFFKNFISKLSTEEGRKQLLVRIKKYKKTESNVQIRCKLVKLRQFLRQDKRDELKIFIPKFKKYCSRNYLQS